MDTRTIIAHHQARLDAGEPLLAAGEWLEELVVRGRPDGGTACHCAIGYSTPGGRTVSPALPVALVDGQPGLPAAAVLGAATTALAADRDAQAAACQAHAQALSAAQARIAELEQSLTAAQARIAELEQSLAGAAS